MSSSPVVIDNHKYHEISSSSSSFEMSDEDVNQSSRNLLDKFEVFNSSSSKRSKNNLSAKQSRIKRRMNDLVLESKLTQLSNENEILRAKIEMLNRKFPQPNPEFDNQSSVSSTTEPISSLSLKRRLKLLNMISNSPM